MKYALCYLLLSYPIPVYEWMRPLRPTLLKVARDYQAIGPKEEYSGLFRYEVRNLRWRLKEVRGCPAIEEAILLPDLDDCKDVERFWVRRIKHMEEELKLHGTYRYVDFADAIEHAKEEREVWRYRQMAVDPTNSYLDRRLALKWLRDE